jgi:hypothetical protein
MNQPHPPAVPDTHPPAVPDTHRIGVLSSLDPARWQSDVVARVMRSHIDLHRNDVSLDLRSVHERVVMSRALWQPALTTAWPTTVHAVVIERDIELHDRERAGAAAMISIETDMFADTMLWCELFEQTLDPAAVDTRTRMLEHLGVDQDPTDGFAAAAASLGGLLTPTDRYCLARAADRGALDEAHAALAAGRTASSAGLVDEIARVAAAIELAILETGPDTGVHHSAVLQQRVAELASELSDERERHAMAERQASEALDAAALREQSLTERLDTAFLRNALQER